MPIRVLTDTPTILFSLHRLFRKFIGSTPEMNHSRQKGDSQCRSQNGQSHPNCQINHLKSTVYIKCEMDRRMHMPHKVRAKQ
eukprot:14092275-Heterocapsa_arctica.AAC.1